ncbi:MAG: hypothetical protein BGO26_10115 [Actinobacteria bacterium 69-20]|nr:MAG: hypothetical protein BGO26_10115 [Actinobacteria bacterium 69-20]
MAAVASYQDAAVHRLGEWARSADAAYTVAERLVQSSFVPSSFQRKPVEAAAAILAGAEVGLSPMAALRSFDVIQGQAAPRAITLRAIVQSFGHEIEMVESTATRCKMRGKRRGSQQWQTVTWTIDRAKDLALTGKDNWKKQPQAMLVARATSELARLIAADAILGIGYAAEEIVDGIETVSEVVSEPALTSEPSQPATRRVSRRSRTVDAEPGSESTEELPITDPQMKKMQALFAEKGFRDSDDRHAFVTQVCDIEVASSRDLTKTQASAVIDRLEALDTLPPDDPQQELIPDAE